jgi:alkyl sulfatase BDS1-like metallo-beta-lactamase superfamily hydrolase
MDIELITVALTARSTSAHRRQTPTVYDRFMGIVLFLLLAGSAAAQDGAGGAIHPRSPLTQGADQQEALKITDSIYQGIGFGNTFMVVTPEGNAIIDTSSPERAGQHVRLLKHVSPAPIKFIILTHAHGDHTGGLPLWSTNDTQIIAQKEYVEMAHYQKRLQGFFLTRNAAQFEFAARQPGNWLGNYGARIEPTIIYDHDFEFKLGGVTFKLMHTPGETPDHTTVWIPEFRAAFCGDNYYNSFPNIYTLRGTKPRWALDYVTSLNKVMSLKPELLLPSHGQALRGESVIAATLTKYRDAIQYVHDETVKGMNAGKDVFTLMREIRLPSNLDVGESYGRVSWSVRGIFEGYAGWFDMNPATMYDLPPTTADADLVRMAGGAAAVVKLAGDRVKEGREVEALRLTDAALAAEPESQAALEVRVKALQGLIARCKNSNERGWLESNLAAANRKLK